MLSSSFETEPVPVEDGNSYLENLSLIPLEELECEDCETWLYVLGSRKQRVIFSSPQHATTVKNLNTTVNLNDQSYSLESYTTKEVLIRDSQVIETVSELEQTKIIDTRTFTRPRKAKLSPSPVKPTLQAIEADNTNLNSTFNFKSATDNGCDVMNATVVIEEIVPKHSAAQADLNSTFPVNVNGSPVHELSPCNNNVYNLNSTFQAQPTANRNVLNTTQTKAVLNATYCEEGPDKGPSSETPRQLSLDELDEIEEDDQLDDEDVFRKPLMPGAVPKKPLVRTSTWNDTPGSSPRKQITPPANVDSGMNELEKCAKLQEEILAQTSTPMGHQRRPAAFRRAAEVENHLGSPISTLPDTTVNYGPPIPLRESLCGNGNSDSSNLDNSNHAIRGQLTFEKSQNSIENPSISPPSPASSPYSSQSLESDSATSQPAAKELIRRSMPNLNTTRLRMPQPTVITNNLNRQHGGSDSGLRPPSSMIRPTVGSVVNGSIARPVQKLPQPTQPLSSVDAEPVPSNRSSQLQRPAMRSSLLPNASKLKPPQLAAPKSSLAPPGRLVAPSVRTSEVLNSTVVMEKPVPPAPITQSTGIPRPALSRIPMPRSAKSSIPTMAVRPRGPLQ